MPIDPASIAPSPLENGVCPLPAASLDTLNLLARRRSAKPFFLADPGPTPAQTEAILTLAARVPDHGKLAPWRFILIEGEARFRLGDTLADVIARPDGASEEAVAAARKAPTHAPLVVAVVSRSAPHPKIPEWEQVLSAGAVSYGVILAATAFGYGAVWLTGWPAYNQEARAALGLAAHERIAALIHIGTQTEAQTERPRPDMRELVTRY
jgi:nitroreductase